MMSTTTNGTAGNTTNESQTPPQHEKTWKEHIEMADGNVRRVIIRNEQGASLLEIPLTAGAVVGGALMLAYPVLTALGALAALLAHVNVEVVRTNSVE
jgi:Domain of unknown function (DUF4342)